MFGCDPPVLKAIRWDTRTMLRELKVPVILIIDGKDPWTPTCHEKSDWIKDEDYFFVKNGFHCPDQDNPK